MSLPKMVARFYDGACGGRNGRMGPHGLHTPCRAKALALAWPCVIRVLLKHVLLGGKHRVPDSAKQIAYFVVPGFGWTNEKNLGIHWGRWTQTS